MFLILGNGQILKSRQTVQNTLDFGCELTNNRFFWVFWISNRHTSPRTNGNTSDGWFWSYSPTLTPGGWSFAGICSQRLAVCFENSDLVTKGEFFKQARSVRKEETSTTERIERNTERRKENTVFLIFFEFRASIVWACRSIVGVLVSDPLDTTLS